MSLLLFFIFEFLVLLAIILSFYFELDPHRFTRSIAALCFFFLGATTYLAILEKKFIGLGILLLSNVLLFATSIVVPQVREVIKVNSLLIIPFITLILGLSISHYSKTERRVNFLTYREKLGTLSFPIFLIHIPIQITLVVFSRLLGISWHFQPLFFVYICTTIFVSLLVHNYFEQPARKWFKRKLAGRYRIAI
jgi:peptidoglycan/LPS O-acetylase OafA/YrhL